MQKGPVKTFLQAKLNVQKSVQLLHSFSTQRLRLTPASLSLEWLIIPIWGEKAKTAKTVAHQTGSFSIKFQMCLVKPTCLNFFHPHAPPPRRHHHYLCHHYRHRGWDCKFLQGKAALQSRVQMEVT